MHSQRIARRSSGLRIFLLALAALVAFALVARPAGAQSPPDDGCEPSEPIACLALPDEAQPADAETPSVATPRAPLPPAPCPPPLAAPDARIAAPRPPLADCARRDVVATVNRANVLYARALRSLDTRDLPLAWGGEALEQVRGYVATLRSTGRYATPELRSILLEELRVEGGSARVRTLENWLYQERASFTGRVLYEANQWVVNLYELRWQGRGWLVTRNDVYEVPAPLPPPARGVAVAANRGVYRLGEVVTATVTNNGPVTVYGGGGYRCGLVQLEVAVGDRWEPASGGAEICPAIAIELRPGQQRTETLPAGPRPGTYRLVVQVTPEGGNGLAAYSSPYRVEP